MPELPKGSEIILVRGQKYIRHEYDWYIDLADRLAPKRWDYDRVICLRDAIRENYQHGWNLPVETLKGSRALTNFILTIKTIDPYATIHEIKTGCTPA